MYKSGPMYCVDMGTTRTRVWLAQGDYIWASAAEDFGVRDVARGGTQHTLRDNLYSLLSRTTLEAFSMGLQTQPACIAAAGMITSPIGLLHVPHIPAPVGSAELARAIRSIDFDLNGRRPMFFIPGVVTGDSKSGLAATLSSDVMRGEETLCIGLIAKGHVAPQDVVFNLGSHWKLIWLDKECRIARSRTSLTGEMIHAVQTQTLLASALPPERPDALDPEWLIRGSDEVSRSGLSRALFCVRLLEQAGNSSQEQRQAFFYGAFLEAEMLALLKDDLLRGVKSICLIGTTSLAEAWQRRLAVSGIHSTILTERQRDIAYVEGLQHLLHARTQ